MCTWQVASAGCFFRLKQQTLCTHAASRLIIATCAHVLIGHPNVLPFYQQGVGQARYWGIMRFALLLCRMCGALTVCGAAAVWKGIWSCSKQHNAAVCAGMSRTS